MSRQWTKIETQAPLRPVEKPRTIRRVCDLDISQLISLIERLPESFWEAETAHRDNNYAVFDATQHAVFRFFENEEDPRRFYSKPGWQVFRQFIEPTLETVARSYGVAKPAYPKVMLARLASRGKIDHHIDDWYANRLSHKVHVPIVSDPGVQFFEQQESFYLEPGSAYEVNNLVPHGVVNASGINRVHLIFELFDSAQ